MYVFRYSKVRLTEMKYSFIATPFLTHRRGKVTGVFEVVGSVLRRHRREDKRVKE